MECWCADESPMDTQWLQDISVIQPEGWPCQLTGAVHVWVDVCQAQVLSVWMHHLILLHIIYRAYSAGNVFSSSVCWGLIFDRISYGDIQDCLWCFFVTVAVFALIPEGNSCNFFREIICREKNWIYHHVFVAMKWKSFRVSSLVDWQYFSDL